MKVKLSIIIDTVEMAGEDHDSLLNRKTGEIVYTTDMDEDKCEDLQFDDDCVMLPTSMTSTNTTSCGTLLKHTPMSARVRAYRLR